MGIHYFIQGLFVLVGLLSVLAAICNWNWFFTAQNTQFIVRNVGRKQGISSIVEILQYLSSEAALKSFVIWTMGSLGDVTGGNLALMLPVVAAGLVLSVAAIKPLNLLLLGENYARTMGLNVQRTRTLLFLSTVLLAGTVTAFCGPVGFIGLAVPHLARMLFASADHRILMPGSMLAGAALLLVCDLISKTLALPINTVTALMGIPVVIIVVVRNRNLF